MTFKFCELVLKIISEKVFFLPEIFVNAEAPLGAHTCYFKIDC